MGSYLANEQTSFQIQQTLKSELGVPVLLTDLTTLTLTLYDAKTGGVINSRNAQSVLNANGGTVHATSGLFTMTFAPADMVIVTATEAEEHHIAIVQATWTGGGAKWQEDLWVRNLALTATVSPALQDNALLTLEEARDTLNITQGDQNARLAALINVVSDRWETETGRRLKSRSYTTLRVGAQGETVLLSPEWPITTLTAVTVGTTAKTVWALPGDVAVDPATRDVILLDEPERNHLYAAAGWGIGLYHIQLTMVAGYGVAGFPIPGDLKEAVAETLRHFYYIGNRQQAAVASRSSGAESITYLNESMPAAVWPVLRSYRKWGT